MVTIKIKNPVFSVYPNIFAAIADIFAHSCGNTVSWRICFAAGSNIDHGQSVLV